MLNLFQHPLIYSGLMVILKQVQDAMTERQKTEFLELPLIDWEDIFSEIKD